MNDSTRQVNPSPIIYGGYDALTNNELEVDNFYLQAKYVIYGTSTAIGKREDSRMNASYLVQLETFLNLPNNWDSYGALPPSENAVRNAQDFLIRLGEKQIQPFFIVPTPNGEIEVELKEGAAHLEFLFGRDGSGLVTGLVDGKEYFEKNLNDTTEHCAIKWLFCPDGDCHNW